MSTSSNDEKLLLRALQLGDHGAFEKLYYGHGKKIYWKLLHMVKDHTEAEEILQELFIKVWNRRTQIDPESSFSAYLYTIAKSMVVDYYRRVARNHKAEKELQSTNSEITSITEEAIDSKETEKLLHRALLRLPDQRRRAFMLCKIEGKSHKEAGEIMGISANTVHNHLVKASKAIKKSILLDHNIASPAMLALLIHTISS